MHEQWGIMIDEDLFGKAYAFFSYFIKFEELGVIHVETYLLTACALTFCIQTWFLLALNVLMPIHTASKQYTQTLHRQEEVHKHTNVHRVYRAGFLKWPAAPFHILICIKLSKH